MKPLKFKNAIFEGMYLIEPNKHLIFNINININIYIYIYSHFEPIVSIYIYIYINQTKN